MNPVYIAVLSFCFFIGAKQLSGRREEWLRGREIAGILVLGGLFSLMVTAGEKIQPDSVEFGAFLGEDILWFLVHYIVGILIFGNLYLLYQKRKLKELIYVNMEKDCEKTPPPQEKTGRIKKRLMYGGLLALAWLPAFLSIIRELYRTMRRFQLPCA